MVHKKGAHDDAKRANAVMCPLRYGDPCTLCMPYVNGPEDCQTVRLVMSDPDLKAEWARGFSAWKRSQRKREVAPRAEESEELAPSAPLPSSDSTRSAADASELSPTTAGAGHAEATGASDDGDAAAHEDIGTGLYSGSARSWGHR